MGYILVLVAITVLILIHEAGHLFMALIIKMPVARFSVGFGPRLFGIKKGGIDYCVSLIPLGGYVMLDLKNLDEMFVIPVWKRVLFLLAGPLANVLVIVPLFMLACVAMNGWGLESLLITPFYYSKMLITTVLTDLRSIIGEPQQIAGLIGIVSEGGRLVNDNLQRLILLTSYLSLNFALINLFPLPILDGGQILLSLMEKVTPHVQKIRIPLAIGGWLLMIGLLLYATVLDVSRFLS